MTSSSIILGLISFAFFLSSCSLQKPSSKPEQASFFISEVKDGSAADSTDQKSLFFREWGIPSQTTFSIEVCVVEKSKLSPLVGEKFIVSEKGWATQTSTDIKGCFQFERPMEYNYFADPVYLAKTFRVRGANRFEGEASFRVALNPFIANRPDASRSPVLPLEYGGRKYNTHLKVAPEKEINQYAFNKKSLLGDVQKARFELTSLRTFSTGPSGELRNCKVKSGRLMRLRGEMSYRLRAIDGSMIYQPLQKGRLAVSAWIISEDGSLFARALPCGSPLNGSITSKTFESDLDFEVLAKDYPTNGLFYMLVKIVPNPTTAPSDLEPEIKYFSLGQVGMGLSETFAQITRLENLPESVLSAGQRALTQSSPLRPDVRSDGNTDERTNSNSKEPGEGSKGQLSSYQLSVLEIDRTPIAVNESPNLAQVKVQIRGRISDRLDLSRCGVPPNKEFIVEASNYQPVDTKASGDSSVVEPNPWKTRIKILKDPICGKFAFEDSIAYRPYSNESLYLREYVFTDPNTGSKFSRTIFLNPWNYPTYAWDTETQAIPKQAQLPPPNLLLRQYEVRTNNLSYLINKYLDLSINKHYTLQLSADYYRKSSFGRHMFSDSLIPGFYYLRVALTRNTLSRTTTPNSVDDFSKIVYVRPGGLITTDITFNLWEIAFMGERMRFILNLIPIAQDQVILNSQENFGLQAEGGGEADKGEVLNPSEADVNQAKNLEVSHLQNLLDRKAKLRGTTYLSYLIPNSEKEGGPLKDSLFEATPDIDQVVEDTRKRQEASERNDKIVSDLSYFDNSYRFQYFSWPPSPEKTSFFEVNNTLGLPAETPRPPSPPEGTSFIDHIIGAQHWTGPLPKQNINYVYLCRLWAENLLPLVVNRYKDFPPPPDDPEKVFRFPGKFVVFQRMFLDRCLKSFKDPTSERGLLLIDRAAAIESLDEENVTYVSGKSWNFTMNSGAKVSSNTNWFAGIDSSTSESVSFSGSWGGEFLGFGARLGSNLSIAKGANKGHNMTFGQGAGIDSGYGTYLVVQQSLLRFDINSYRKCLLIKPSWLQMNQLLYDYYEGAFKTMEEFNSARRSVLTEQIKKGEIKAADPKELAALTASRVEGLNRHTRLILADSGLRVCEDDLSGPLKNLPEYYYYVTQHFNPGASQDTNDRRNQPWLTSLRGHRDFFVLFKFIEMNLIQAQKIAKLAPPDEAISEAKSLFARFQKDGRDPIDAMLFPYERLKKWYVQLQPKEAGSDTDKSDFTLEPPEVISEIFGSTPAWKGLYIIPEIDEGLPFSSETDKCVPADAAQMQDTMLQLQLKCTKHYVPRTTLNADDCFEYTDMEPNKDKDSTSTERALKCAKDAFSAVTGVIPWYVESPMTPGCEELQRPGTFSTEVICPKIPSRGR